MRFYLLLPALLAGCSLTARLPGLGTSQSSPPSRPGSGSSVSASAPSAPTTTSSTVADAPAQPFAEDCPSYESADEKIEPLVTFMRCPNTEPRGDTIESLGRARAWLRGGIDTTIAEPPNHLLRALYVHLCARQLHEDPRPYPAMAIGCAWHADRLDHNGLAKELATRPAAQRGTLAKQAAADVREVREGFECGIGVENFNDIKVGDLIEAYRIEQVARSLDSGSAAKGA